MIHERAAQSDPVADATVTIDQASRLATTLPAGSSLHIALTAPYRTVVRATTLAAQRDDITAVRVLCPLLATRAGQIPIAWQDPAGDTVVTLELWTGGNLLWSASSATSPVLTPPIAPDKVLDLRLRDAASGALIARETFVTVTAPPAPADPLAAIVADATATPARLGDAVAAWWSLPPTAAATPAARRVGLWLAEETRLPELREAALAP